ncbi:unnamed protein product, partial [Mesorhabditis spiculigera]
MPIACSTEACTSSATIKRARDGDPVCTACFTRRFEEDVHETISSTSLFKRGERVAIGASGGKDSTVLAYAMKVLNERHDYGLELILLSIDEGIKGYRDDSLKSVERNKIEYQLPLTILSYKDLYGWSMDEIVAKIGKKNNCTFCGVFRRQALDRGSYKLGCTKLVTGHNADDIAETVLMNLLRGDVARLERCTNICTGEDGGSLPRAKPLKYSYEKDIVMYARVNKLEYFYTECIYAPNAYRNFARDYIKKLERVRPRAILDIIISGESVAIRKEVAMPVLGNCSRCNYISSQKLCKACLLIEGLNTDNLQLGTKKKATTTSAQKTGCKSEGEPCECRGDQDGGTVENNNSGNDDAIDRCQDSLNDLNCSTSTRKKKPISFEATDSDATAQDNKACGCDNDGGAAKIDF